MHAWSARGPDVGMLWTARAQAYADSKGVKLVGDVPIYDRPESADLWAYQTLHACHALTCVFIAQNRRMRTRRASRLWATSPSTWAARARTCGAYQNLFELDAAAGSPIMVSGVPPMPSPRRGSCGDRPCTTGRCGKPTRLKSAASCMQTLQVQLAHRHCSPLHSTLLVGARTQAGMPIAPKWRACGTGALCLLLACAPLPKRFACVRASQAHKEDGYRWWVQRLSRCFQLHDEVRVGPLPGVCRYER